MNLTRLPSCSATAVARLSYQHSRAQPPNVFEGMDVTTHECLEALPVGKLQVHLAAVRFHQAEGVQLAGRAGIEQSSEVTPIDVEAFTGAGLDAHVSPAGFGCGSDGPQVIPNDLSPPSYSSVRSRCVMTVARASGSCSSNSAMAALNGSSLLERSR